MKLKLLCCNGTYISNLSLANSLDLETLYVYYTAIKHLNLMNNTKLTHIRGCRGKTILTQPGVERDDEYFYDD